MSEKIYQWESMRNRPDHLLQMDLDQYDAKDLPHLIDQLRCLSYHIYDQPHKMQLVGNFCARNADIAASMSKKLGLEAAALASILLSEGDVDAKEALGMFKNILEDIAQQDAGQARDLAVCARARVEAGHPLDELCLDFLLTCAPDEKGLSLMSVFGDAASLTSVRLESVLKRVEALRVHQPYQATLVLHKILDCGNSLTIEQRKRASAMLNELSEDPDVIRATLRHVYDEELKAIRVLQGHPDSIPHPGTPTLQ